VNTKLNDVTDDGDTADEENDEEEEESFIETIVQKVLYDHADTLSNYVSDPNSPDELTENESIRKFIALKVRGKVMDFFECMQQWQADVQLKKLYRAYKKVMKKDPDLESNAATKQILRKDNIIEEVIERILEEELDGDEEELDSDEEVED